MPGDANLGSGRCSSNRHAAPVGQEKYEGFPTWWRSLASWQLILIALDEGTMAQKRRTTSATLIWLLGVLGIVLYLLDFQLAGMLVAGLALVLWILLA